MHSVIEDGVSNSTLLQSYGAAYEEQRKDHIYGCNAHPISFSSLSGINISLVKSYNLLLFCFLLYG